MNSKGYIGKIGKVPAAFGAYDESLIII